MIKEGAKLVAEYTDVLEELKLPEMKERATDCPVLQESLEVSATITEINNEDGLEGLDEEELAILARLSGEPVHVDDLCRQAGMTIATITSMLTLLELKGKVVQVGTMHYIRATAAGVKHGS